MNSIQAASASILTRMQGPAHERSVEAIAARLIATRKALNLNQRQLCERVGIATNTYNQWEKAKGRPDLDGALLICDKLNLTLDWIYRGDESRLPHDLAVKLSAREPPKPRQGKKKLDYPDLGLV